MEYSYQFTYSREDPDGTVTGEWEIEIGYKATFGTKDHYSKGSNAFKNLFTIERTKLKNCLLALENLITVLEEDKDASTHRTGKSHDETHLEVLEFAKRIVSTEGRE